MSLTGLQSHEESLAVLEQEQDLIAGPDGVGQTKDSEEMGRDAARKEMRCHDCQRRAGEM